MNNILNKIKLNKLIQSNEIIQLTGFIINTKKIINNRDEFDCIYFNSKKYDEFKETIFLVVNYDLNIFSIAYPKKNDDLENNCYVLNYQITKNIKPENCNIKIYKLNNKNILHFKNIKVQDFQDIRDESIKLSKSYQYLLNTNSSYYIIRNNNSNCKLIIGKNHLKFSDTLDDDSIKLNRKQRILLNALDIKDEHNNYIDYDLSIYPYPCLINEQFSFIKKISKTLLKIYVGKVNIGLIAKRTYQSDETFNIVRLSNDIMKVLGIKDTDIVKITYLDTSCYARVLPINDKNKLLEQNNEKNSIPIVEFENVIFIPAFLRSELGIPSVVSNIAVKVERDMGYIFKKNINQQILPIILILFSTEIFVNGRELLVKIIIALISLPITMYFNLSNERAISK